MAEAAPLLEEYTVTEDCIACDACCDDFPDIFKMNADHTRAIAYAKSPVGKFNPWEIITDCPVDAIKLTNMPMPPRPPGMEEKKKEEPAPIDTGNWRERWVAVKDQPEDQWERMKRYGMASTISDDGDHYTMRFDMPEFIPNHELKFKWGLPDKMPDYKYSVEVINGRRVKVRAKLEDPQVLKLTGWVNSFPSGFLKEIKFAEPIKAHKENYDPESHVLTVTLEKDVAAKDASAAA
jgi:ferredoxin